MTTDTLTVEEINEYQRRLEIYAAEQGLADRLDSKWDEIFAAAREGLNARWRDILEAPREGEDELLIAMPALGGGWHFERVLPNAIEYCASKGWTHFMVITPPERGA